MKTPRFNTLYLAAVIINLMGCGSDKSDPVTEPVTAPVPAPLPAPTPPPPTAPDEVDDTEMVSVPAGKFTMGCQLENKQLCSNSEPAHEVNLDAFKVDKYKVTYRRYNQCLEAGECTPLFEGAGCNANMPWNSNHPVNCVDYRQAETFCNFENKRLLTEAEWEKAARGTDNRPYTWGSEPPSCDLAVMNQKVGDNTMGPGCGAGTTRPVGSKPAGASPYGVMDMAGNLFEWTSDWYSTSYFAESPVDNPRGPASGEHKVLRGSSWLMRTEAGMYLNVRSGYSPLGQGYVVGFRCASDD